MARARSTRWCGDVAWFCRIHGSIRRDPTTQLWLLDAGARRGRLGRLWRLGGDWALGLLPWLESDEGRGRQGEEGRGERDPAAASACGNKGGRDRAGREMGIGEESREMVRERSRG